MVLKNPPGEWHPCGDYRLLDTATKPNRYPISFLQDVSSAFCGKKVFPKKDLVRAYHQISIEPADVPKTAIVTPFGIFEFVRMPFGLMNASRAFQRFINEVLHGFYFAFAYLDDLLIACTDEDEHAEHLLQLFRRLNSLGVIVNPIKCIFGAPQLEFLGHMVDHHGVYPVPENVDAISQFPAPQTIEQLQRFLSMLKFYRRFLPRAAEFLLSLTTLLAGNPKMRTPITLNRSCNRF